MDSDSDMSPPPTRSYPFVYEAWRRTRPEPYYGRREHSVDNKIFASPYEVPRQVTDNSVIECSQTSSSSGRTDKRAGSRPRCAACIRAGDDNDDRRGRLEVTHTAERKTKNPSSRTGLNQDSDISEDNEVKTPTYTKSCHCEDHLINAVKDIKLTATEKCSGLNIIPEFDPKEKGQTVDSWINKVEECRKIYDWSDMQTAHYAILKLSGTAKTWYLRLPTVIFSWDELKEKLKEVFPVILNYAELLTDMLSVRVHAGESLELYYQQKMQLLHRCNISGKEAVDCLVHGMRDEVPHVAMQAAQFTEPGQVLKLLKSVK